MGEAQNRGLAHAERRRRMSDSEVSSIFLDGFEADLRNDITQLSPTVPASSGTEPWTGCGASTFRRDSTP